MADPHALPTGTVTFLFTDIEGSTRLWDENPDAMRLALAHHDTFLKAAIETHGGRVFKTVGDAFCASFASAPDALQAAIGAQRALQAKDEWPPPTPTIVGTRRVPGHPRKAEGKLAEAEGGSRSAAASSGSRPPARRDIANCKLQMSNCKSRSPVGGDGLPQWRATATSGSVFGPI